jgi:hypothetical protein
LLGESVFQAHQRVEQLRVDRAGIRKFREAVTHR